MILTGAVLHSVKEEPRALWRDDTGRPTVLEHRTDACLIGHNFRMDIEGVTVEPTAQVGIQL